MKKKIRRIQKLLGPFQKTFLLILGVSILQAVSTSLLALLLGKMIAQSSETFFFHSNQWPPITSSKNILLFLLILFFGLLLLRTISNFYRTRLTGKLAYEIGENLRHKIVQYLLFAPFLQILKIQKGELISRFSQDVKSVQGFFSFGVMGIIQNTITGFLLLIIAFIHSPILVFMGALIVPIIFVGLQSLLRKSRSYYKTYLDHEGDLSRIINETKELLPTIRIFHQEGFFLNRFNHFHSESKKSFLKALHFQSFISPWVQGGYVLALFAVIGISLGFGMIEASSIEEIATIVVSLGFLYRPIQNISLSLDQINQGFLSLNRVEAVSGFDVKNVDTKKENFKWSSFSVKNVFFEIDEIPILRKINLDLFPHQTVAFVGPNGAGKTSLLYLLSGLLEQNEGEIEVLTTNKSILRPFEAKNLFCWMGLDGQLFQGKISENICFKSENLNTEEKEQLRQAFESAKVESAKASKNHSEKVDVEDFQIEENGSNFSKGEKQKLGLARAFFHDRSILILDEPTSGLDAESKKHFLKMLASIQKEKKYTLWIATHDEDVAMATERMVLMNDGEIIQDGKPNEIISKTQYF